MKKAVWVFVFMACVFAASAKSVSLQIIQRNTTGGDVYDTSYVVEQAILDYFFERGMIVSNNEIIVSNNDDAVDRKQLRRSYAEAQSGSMDYIINIFLNYSLADSPNPSAILLKNIKDADMEIISLSDMKTIGKGTFAPQKINSQNNNRGGVESFATDIAKNIQARLAGKGGAR